MVNFLGTSVSDWIVFFPPSFFQNFYQSNFNIKVMLIACYSSTLWKMLSHLPIPQESASTCEPREEEARAGREERGLFLGCGDEELPLCHHFSVLFPRFGFFFFFCSDTQDTDSVCLWSFLLPLTRRITEHTNKPQHLKRALSSVHLQRPYLMIPLTHVNTPNTSSCVFMHNYQNIIP